MSRLVWLAFGVVIWLTGPMSGLWLWGGMAVLVFPGVGGVAQARAVARDEAREEARRERRR